MAIRIGTRGSKLALWQAEWVSQQLISRGCEVELKIISTTGDTSTASLSQVGGQGVFTKEIQRELLAENVDVAVHSLKDLPTEVIEGLTIAAVPPRETTRDCLVSKDGEKLLNLESGARIGTGSLRRGSQILAWRSDVEIADIRGNVDSRLRKLEEGQYDAIVLAAAGLTRLKLTEHITEHLPQDKILPAIGQGALGLECRSEDSETHAALSKLNDSPSYWAVGAERSFLASLLAGCLAPVAALATISGEQLTLHGRVIARDGSKVVEGEHSGKPEDAKQIGEALADKLRTEGAAELIAAARDSLK
ncbi:MAG: hydroxymethylbilane synthase [Aureliella sp.]